MPDEDSIAIRVEAIVLNTYRASFPVGGRNADLFRREIRDSIEFDKIWSAGGLVSNYITAAVLSRHGGDVQMENRSEINASNLIY